MTNTSTRRLTAPAASSKTPPGWSSSSNSVSPLPTASTESAGTPPDSRSHSRTRSARRSDRSWLYSALARLSVCPTSRNLKDAKSDVSVSAIARSGSSAPGRSSSDPVSNRTSLATGGSGQSGAGAEVVVVTTSVVVVVVVVVVGGTVVLGGTTTSVSEVSDRIVVGKEVFKSSSATVGKPDCGLDPSSGPGSDPSNAPPPEHAASTAIIAPIPTRTLNSSRQPADRASGRKQLPRHQPNHHPLPSPIAARPAFQY